MEDERIIDLYWKRDQAAITETEQKYGVYCGRIAGNILHSREDCEECLNDTWLRAWHSMPKERPALLGAFLGAITRNLSLDRYRRKHTQKRGAGEITLIFDELRDCAGGDEPCRQVEQRELAESINRFLGGQKQRDRMIFVRRYWYMDSIGQIAVRFGIGESRVKSSLFRSRKKLREHLLQEDLL